MRSLIVLVALVAFACAHDHSRGDFDTKRAEMREKWQSMTEEERQEKIQSIRNGPAHPHHFKKAPEEVHQKMQEKFAAMTPEERQKLREKITDKVRKDISTLPEEVQQKILAKFASMKEKFSAMTEDERKAEFEKVRAHHSRARPQLKDMPEEVRQRIHEKFASLTPEQRQTIFQKIHGKPMQDGPTPYETPVAASHHPHMNAEDKQKFRERFESMTPEERDQMRQQMPVRDRLPLMHQRPGNREDFERIRNNRDNDRMINDQWARDMSAHKKDQ